MLGRTVSEMRLLSILCVTASRGSAESDDGGYWGAADGLVTVAGEVAAQQDMQELCLAHQD